jgi:hypothetical protein
MKNAIDFRIVFFEPLKLTFITDEMGDERAIGGFATELKFDGVVMEEVGKAKKSRSEKNNTTERTCGT